MNQKQLLSLLRILDVTFFVLSATILAISMPVAVYFQVPQVFIGGILLSLVVIALRGYTESFSTDIMESMKKQKAASVEAAPEGP